MVAFAQGIGKRLSPECHRQLIKLTELLTQVRRQLLRIESCYPDIHHDARLNLPELDAVNREVLHSAGDIMHGDILERVARIGGARC